LFFERKLKSDNFSRIFVSKEEVEVSPAVEEELEKEGPTKVSNTTREGTLFKDEIWSGEILVTDTVTVPKGITLTIEPSTVVKFKHCRDYKGFCHRIGLIIQGGVLKAIGTPEQ